jgi:hypothetical protein
VTIALSAGGFREATCNALKPPHDTPIMPTAPVHQVCAANHAMTSRASSNSWGVYSSESRPSDSPCRGCRRGQLRTQNRPHRGA